MAGTNINWSQLFGIQVGDQEDPKKRAIEVPSFAPPPNEDGAIEVAPGGAYGTYVDLEGSAKNEGELVTKYRSLALQAEVDSAIEDIVNEAIIIEDMKPIVSIDMDEVPSYSDSIKKRVREEFKVVLKLLDFQNNAYDIFKRWYVDGRLYYHLMVNQKQPRDGIQELRYIDPRRIRKVREPIKAPIASQSGPGQVVVPVAYNEYYIYMQNGATGSSFTQQGIKISKDSIAYVHSGLLDEKNKLVLGYLHKAIKPMNQLRMLEDATVIYRLARAPERRVFYIDVGNLPKMKAEQYLKDIMTKHKNRLVYDATTGDIRDDRKFMTMTEDFWLTRREGSRGTEISNLPGGQNLGQMDDVEYFRRKLYKSLHVPVSRIQSDTTFNFGKASEITRDEVKFAKMIDRMRARFCHLFNKILEIQLALRGVMTKEEFKSIKEYIKYDFLRDNYFAELKDQEVLTTRMNILGAVDPFVGKYFSKTYVKKKILRFTDEEIEELDDEMEEEQEEEMMNNPNPFDPNAPQDPNMPPDDGAGGPPGAPPPNGQGFPQQSNIPSPPKKPSMKKFSSMEKKPMGKKPMKEEVILPNFVPTISEEDQQLIDSMNALLKRTGT